MTLNHALRAKGIGSSEIAMLVLDDDGKPLSPWGGPHKLWRIKTGQELPQDDKDRPWLERGKALEPWILARYAQKTHSRIRKSPGTVQHPKYPYVVDSVDALAWYPGDDKAPSRCVEAKAPLLWTIRDEWGEEGTDQIPKQYLIQGQWHCTAWQLKHCDYPIDAGGDVKVYHSVSDTELELALLQIAERFWIDHVKANVAPPVDARSDTSEWLSKRLKQRDEDILDADESIVRLMLEYRETRLRYNADKAKLEQMANELKLAIGDHKGICLPGQPKAKITFSKVKGRTAFDHERYIEALLELVPEARRPERQPFMKTDESYRRFLPTGLLKEGDK